MHLTTAPMAAAATNLVVSFLRAEGGDRQKPAGGPCKKSKQEGATANSGTPQVKKKQLMLHNIKNDAGVTKLDFILLMGHE